MSYTNPNCTPCTAEQIVLTPCTTGCPIMLSEACVIHKGAAIACLGIEVDETWDTILVKLTDAICASDTYLFDITCLGGSATANIGDTVNTLIDYICDTVISFPTFNASCLGGSPTETMSNTINYLITAACAAPTTLTFGALTWTCLTPPVSSDIDDVLQALINNIKTTSLSFGAGFTVTPLTCGSLVEYTGAGAAGIALTTGTGTFATGFGIGSFIDVTPTSGINSSYNIAPLHVNEAYVVLGPYLSANIATTTATIRLRWDKEVEFDGPLTIEAAAFVGLDHCYNSIQIPLLFGLPVKYRPTHASGAKVFPVNFHVTDSGSTNLPGCVEPWACSYKANLVIPSVGFPGAGTMVLEVLDCNFAVDLETKTFDSGLIWITPVQYHTV